VGWSLAALTSLASTVLSAVTNVFTGVFPDSWRWADDPWTMGLSFGALTLLLVMLTVVQFRRTDGPDQPSPSVPGFAPDVLPDGAASARVPLTQPGGSPIWAATMVVGRERLVGDLKTLWRNRKRRGTAGIVVLHGGGGTGKSTIAWLLATGCPEGVRAWWVTATTAEQLRGQLRQVALEAGGTETQVEYAWSGHRDPAALLYELLESYQDRWMLVIDDANDPRLLAGVAESVAVARGWLRPPPDNGLILVTTRDGSPGQWGPQCRLVQVDRLAVDHAAQLLQALAPNAGSSEQAKVLAIRLGRLPLTLRLAGVYLNRAANSHLPGVPTTFATYLETYQAGIGHDGSELEELLTAVRGAVAVSLKLLSQRGADQATPLLRLLALFAAAPIRLDWLHPSILATYPRLHGLTGGRLQTLLDGLHQFDLITNGSEVVALHQDVRDAMRDTAGDNPGWRTVTEILQIALPANRDPYNRDGLPLVESVTPHVLELLQNSPTLPDSVAATAVELVSRTIRSLDIHGTINRKTAKQHYEAVLRIQRRLLGEEDRDTLRTRNCIAAVLHDMSDLPAARAEYEAVMEIQRRALGTDDPDTLRTMTNHAGVLSDLDDLPAARLEFEAVLAAQGRVLGEDDRETLGTRYSLAVILADQGETAAARLEFEAVLAAQGRVLGEDDRETLGTRYSLAVILADQGETAAARAELEAVLAAQGRALGEDDRETLRTRHSLASVLSDLGQEAEARSQFQIVLAAQGRVLGEYDRDTLSTRYSRAAMLLDRGETSAAQVEFEAVLAAQCRTLGEDDRDTVRTKTHLDSLLGTAIRSVDSSD
jgi:hypothetical protein